MSQTWEEKFRIWAQSPSKSETDRLERTERAIREAIHASFKLSSRSLKIFTQGSFRNRTNVRRESDIDVGVLCYDTFFYELPPQKTDAQFGISPATYSYAQFKNEVGEALVAKFGSLAVSRGNKAFDIKAPGSQVEADVAPFFEHRRYSENGKFLSGVELRPDNGLPPKIVNWPEQHYENGNNKNNLTGRRYRALVRIMKSLRNEMRDEGKVVAEPIIGFLNECLVWNVPNSQFGNTTYTQDLRNVLAYLYVNTDSDQKCNEWGEVSELKYLFRPSQKWTRQQANDFILAAWRHVGF